MAKDENTESRNRKSKKNLPVKSEKNSGSGLKGLKAVEVE